MKKTMYLILSFIVLMLSCKKDKTDNVETPSFDYSFAELINAYRVEQGLSEIPVSPSLTLVADTHVKDLENNNPNQGNCNLHSWSSNGNWSSCCYTPDHAQADCMWDKPRELTIYTGNGYEIAAWSSSDITAEQALSMWQSSSGHHDVILNNNTWANTQWKAIGAAIYKGYAVVWFGSEIDPANK